MSFVRDDQDFPSSNKISGAMEANSGPRTDGYNEDILKGRKMPTTTCGKLHGEIGPVFRSRAMQLSDMEDPCRSYR